MTALPLSIIAAEPPPAEHFTRPPAIDQVFVSPSGKRMALLVGSKEGRTQVATLTLDPPGEGQIVGAFSDADVTDVRWVNDNRIVFEAFEAKVADIRSGRGGTFAVDFDGTNPRQLIAWVNAINETSSALTSKLLPYGWFVHSTLDDGSDEVLVVRHRTDNRGEVERIQPARLDTRTGYLRSLAYGMPRLIGDPERDAELRLPLVVHRAGGLDESFALGRAQLRDRHAERGDLLEQRLVGRDQALGPRERGADDSRQAERGAASAARQTAARHRVRAASGRHGPAPARAAGSG